MGFSATMNVAAAAHGSSQTKHRFDQVVRFGLRSGLLVHSLFIPLFYAIGSTTLALINIGSVALYAAALHLIDKPRFYGLALMMAWVEILGHALLAVIAIGWESGFHYYVLTLLPLIFMRSTKRSRLQVLYAATLCGLYIALDALMHVTGPIDHINAEVLAALRYVNMAATFLLLAALVNAYMRIINETERQLQESALRDALTGLYNRRHLLTVAEYERTKRARSRQPLSVILVDLDDFKSINDTLGHDAGDAVLKAAAERMRDAVRKQDTVARWGGEEFLILLPDTTADQARDVAERIRCALYETPVTHGGQQVAMSGSFGVTDHRSDEAIDTTIARADRALYSVKQDGKNQVRRA